MLLKEYMILKKKNLFNFEENLLFSGIVSHERIKPFNHSFKYNLTYFWFDINLSDKYKLLKKNKLSLCLLTIYSSLLVSIICLIASCTCILGTTALAFLIFLIIEANRFVEKLGLAAS